MSPDMSRVLRKIHDASYASEAWPEALRTLTDALGVPGAACIVVNKQTRGADWVCFSGLSDRFQSRYVDRFVKLDPFTPLLNVEFRWMKVSECFSLPFLRRDEWYNDFILNCGVRDILACRLMEKPSHVAVFGVHQQIGRFFRDETASIMEQLALPLRSAMQRHVDRLFAPTGHAREQPTARAAQYYFHVDGVGQYQDDCGKSFSSPEEAVAHASTLAAELSQSGDWEGYWILVAHDDGSLIARIPVSR
jgi:hypothetical protein